MAKGLIFKGILHRIHRASGHLAFFISLAVFDSQHAFAEFGS